jgi:multidrug resistance efflux pump
VAVAYPLARDDLEVAVRTVKGDVTYIVGDPITGEFQELDELQHEVFKRLDGKHSLADIAATLVAEHDIEIDTEELSEFVDNLQELNLLDLSTDLRLSERDGKAIALRVQRQLQIDGVVFARRSRSRERRLGRRGDDRRHRHLEAAMFDAALYHLERGRVREAASYLRTVVDRHPTNKRARYLLHVLSSEHLGKPSGFESVWFWRIKLFNPDRVLAVLDRLVGRVLFTRAALVLWCLFALVTLVTLLGELSRLEIDIRTATRPGWIGAHFEALVLVFLVRRFVIFGHEMMHGLACHHFGGRVREIGLLFVYLVPGAYCDISSTYLVPHRWHRALVSAVGPMWDIGVICVLTWIWHLTDLTSLVGQVAFVCIPFSVYAILWNIHPFIKNDGYLALSDLLERNSLREDAFSYLNVVVRRFLFARRIVAPDELERDRKVLLRYAVPAAVGTVALVGTSFLFMLRGLIAQFYTAGLFLGLTLIFFALRKPGTQLWSFLWKNRVLLWSSRRFRLLILGTFLGLVAVGSFPARFVVETEARIVPEIVRVRAPLDERVVRFPYEEGTRVSAGDVIAVLDDARLRTALIDVEARIEEQESLLFQMLAGAREEELDIARARYGAASEDLRDAQRRVAKLSRLATQGLAPRAELDRALADAAAARTLQSTSYASIQVVSAGARDADIRTVRVTLETLQAERARAAARLEQAFVRAPVGGTLVWIALDHGEDAAGLSVKAGDELFWIRQDGLPLLEAEIPLSEPISVMSAGAYAEARLHGLSGVPVEGTLERIAPTVELAVTGEPILRATIRLSHGLGRDDPPLGLGGVVRIAGDRAPYFVHAYLKLMRIIEVDLQGLYRMVR